MKGAGSDYIWKEQVIVLLFHSMGFVETMKISSFVISSVHIWEEFLLPQGLRAVVLLLNNTLCLLGLSLMLLDSRQVFIITA